MKNQNKASRFLKKIQKHYEWLIVIPLLAFVISCIYTFFIATPIYESSSELLITTSSTETEEVIDNPTPSMATYSYILTSDVILEPVIEGLELKTTPSTLREQVVAEHIEDSEILTIQVQNENPYKASEIANAIAGNFEEVVEETTETETVRILTAAVPNTDSIHPNNLLTILIGTLIGFVISLVIVASQGRENKTEILSPERVEELTGLKSIGKISPFTEEDYMILRVRPINNEDDAEETAQEDEETLSRMRRHQL